jgi:hypothetical protein
VASNPSGQHCNYNNAAKTTATPPTSNPVATLALVAAPDALLLLEGLDVLVLLPPPDVVFEGAAFSIATPLTPVAFLHSSADKSVAFFEKTISAHYTYLVSPCFSKLQ